MSPFFSAVAFLVILCTIQAEPECASAESGDIHAPGAYRLEIINMYAMGRDVVDHDIVLETDYCNDKGATGRQLAGFKITVCDSNGRTPEVVMYNLTHGHIHRVGKLEGVASVDTGIYCKPFFLKKD